MVDPALIDEFCPLLQEKRSLDARLRVLTSEGSRFDTLDKLIRAAADKKPAHERLLLEGTKFDLEATPKENEASPDWKALVKAFGLKLLLKFASISQKAVKAMLAEQKKPESAYEMFFTKNRTGPRKMVVMVKPYKEAA